MTKLRFVVYYFPQKDNRSSSNSVNMKREEVDEAVKRLRDEYYFATLCRIPGLKGSEYMYLAKEGVFRTVPTVYSPEDSSKQENMIIIESQTQEGCDRTADELGLPRVQRSAEGLASKLTEAKK